ncbi:hypothetical protein ACU6U9_16915 [Pseudomonas sp. HK3]|jgi:hypothetical protein
MVAQRKTYIRCKEAVYLVLALTLISACSDDEYTVVELHHRQPSELLPILDKQLSDEIKYNMTGQTIVFYANAAELKPTIALLSSLDKPSSIYTLAFSWMSKHKRSTTRLPPPITIQSNTSNTINMFDNNWQVSIEPISQANVLMTLLQKSKSNEAQENQLFLSNSQGTTIHLVKQEDEHEKLEQQFVLPINEKSGISHSLLPKNLAITVKGL